MSDNINNSIEFCFNTAIENIKSINELIKNSADQNEEDVRAKIDKPLECITDAINNVSGYNIQNGEKIYPIEEDLEHVLEGIEHLGFLVSMGIKDFAEINVFTVILAEMLAGIESARIDIQLANDQYSLL